MYIYIYLIHIIYIYAVELAYLVYLRYQNNKEIICNYCIFSKPENGGGGGVTLLGTNIYHLGQEESHRLKSTLSGGDMLASSRVTPNNPDVLFKKVSKKRASHDRKAPEFFCAWNWYPGGNAGWISLTYQRFRELLGEINVWNIYLHLLDFDAKCE